MARGGEGIAGASGSSCTRWADGRQTPGLVSCRGPDCPRGCLEQDTGWPGLRPAEGQLEGCCLRLQGQR